MRLDNVRLDVSGAVAGETPVWTFDLANPESCLSLAGAFTFPDAAKRKIVVELRGEPTPRTRILADLTGLAAGAATVPAFRLGDGYPSSYRLVYENGFLRISNAVGTLLIFR